MRADVSAHEPSDPVSFRNEEWRQNKKKESFLSSVSGSRLITKLIFHLRVELGMQSAESHISPAAVGAAEAPFATRVSEWTPS